MSRCQIDAFNRQTGQPAFSEITLPVQPVDATQALNLMAQLSHGPNLKVSESEDSGMERTEMTEKTSLLIAEKFHLPSDYAEADMA